RNVLVVPRIACRTKGAVEARGPHPELVHVRLADDDRASRLEFHDSHRVVRWNTTLEGLERRRGPAAGRVVEILEGDGNAMKRPARSARLNFSFGFSRKLPGLVGEDSDEGVQPGIECLDSRQARFHNLDG